MSVLSPPHVVSARPLAAARRTGDPWWTRAALGGVLLLAALLYGWGLSGDANQYYSAAVRSGTESWKAFFFGSLDSASFITVDKPPMALWAQELTARVIGFGSWSLLLPEVVMGVAAVFVLYVTVRRVFGPVAGLLAALVMALTPITVAINRDNNPDTLLVLLLVLSAWACQHAVSSGRLRWLIASAFFLGCGFNTKMLQAYLLLPALCSVYLLFAPGGRLRRVWHLLAAGVVLAVSSFWWMVVVDLIPASSRPYIGGSTDGTVWDLIIGYNGLGRVTGNEGGGPGGGGPGGGASFAGASGVGRLFNSVVGGQISWLLPFAALVLVVGVVTMWRRPRTDLPRAAVVLWGGWLVVHFVVFSFSNGTMHPYYTTALAPAVSALTAIGGVLSLRALRSPIPANAGGPVGAASRTGRRGTNREMADHRARRDTALSDAPTVDGPGAGDGRRDAASPGGGAQNSNRGSALTAGTGPEQDATPAGADRRNAHPPAEANLTGGVDAAAGQPGVEGQWSATAWSWVLPVGAAVTGGWSFFLLRRTPSWNPWLAWTVLVLTVLVVAVLVTVLLSGRLGADGGPGVRRGALSGPIDAVPGAPSWPADGRTSGSPSDVSRSSAAAGSGPAHETVPTAANDPSSTGTGTPWPTGSATSTSAETDASTSADSTDTGASSPGVPSSARADAEAEAEFPGAEPAHARTGTDPGGAASFRTAGADGAAGAGLRSRMGQIAVVAAICAMVAGLAGPTAYAVSAAGSSSNGTNPLAGPSGGFGMFGPGMRGGFPDGGRRMEGRLPGGLPQSMPPGGFPGRGAFPSGGPGGEVSDRLISYLRKNRGNATWLLAVSSAQSASPIIIKTGEPVMAMGGFTGGDPAMTVAKLQQYVKSGKLRYVMVGGGGPGGGASSVTSWVTQNCQAVSASEYGGGSASSSRQQNEQGSSQQQNGQGLYRCT